MELRQLSYFVMVADELHFRRAAQRLHMSQPPLSQQIRRLEDELGVRLLVRDRRAVSLTPAGREFARDARRLLDDAARAVEAARRVAAGEEGRLRITFAGSALLSLLPRVVQRLRAARPAVRVELRERPSEDQVAALEAGEADIGLVPLPLQAEGLHSEVLLRERVVAALPAGHELAERRRVTLPRLAREPLVLFPRVQAPGLHDRLLSSLGESGVAPVVVQYAAETQTIIGLVAAGIGISLVQESVSQLELPGVVYRPVSGAPVIELAAITRAGEDAPLVELFLAFARE